jgi:glutathione synthase/RimK-type ligase-like ATP-grasp enzyme
MVFYIKKDALKWIDKTSFPKVFKLRGGAGATNVKLVKSKSEARKLTKRAFGRGFPQFNRWNNLGERIRRFKEGKDNIMSIIKGIVRLFIPTEFAKMYPREKGYVYFQEFIPNNNFDTRIVVVGGKAAAERRMVRENDFRASGSGKFCYDNINIESVKIAFDVAQRLKLLSVAFDFVEDENSNPLIVEISYGFGTSGIDNAPGYWDSSLQWHEGKFNPQEWMIKDMICSQ